MDNEAAINQTELQLSIQDHEEEEEDESDSWRGEKWETAGVIYPWLRKFPFVQAELPIRFYLVLYTDMNYTNEWKLLFEGSSEVRLVAQMTQACQNLVLDVKRMKSCCTNM